MPYLTPEHEVIFKRTEEWIAGADPLGQDEAALTAAAAQQDIEVRVIARDGQRFPLRADFRPSRVNVEIVDGHVARVDGFG